MEQQILFVSPEITQKFGAAVNNVASLICLLSKNGEQEITATETFMSERVAMSVRLISKAKKTLRDNGYITTVTQSKGFKKITAIKVTEKMLQAFNSPITHSVRDRTSTVCVTDTAQCAFPITHKMSDITHSVRDDHAQYACPDNAQCAYINKEEIIEINRNEIYIAQQQSDIPVPTDEDAPVEVERDEMPIGIHLVDEAPKKTKRATKTIVYPASSDEVLEMFKAWRDKHIKVEPRIQGVNLPLEAEKFFEYWNDQDWKRNGKKMKSVNGSIATWLGNACERVRGNYKPASVESEAKVRAIVEQFNPDKSSPLEAEFEVVDEVKPELLAVLMR